MTIFWLGLLVIASAAAAWILVGVIRRFAERREILDHPNERSSHTTPRPRGGGLAIVAVTLTGAIAIEGVTRAWAWPQFVAYVAAAVIVSAVSSIDDVRGLSAAVRLAVHAAAALTTILAFGYWREIAVPAVGTIVIGVAGAAVTLLWIAGLTNAYNFMDGIDGIAGVQAVVAGIAFAAIARPHDSFASGVAVLIAGSSVGFLRHNWQPATIFMGDVGSAFIGYSLAALAVAGSVDEPRLIPCYVLPVWPFVFDTAFTFLRRLGRGERIFSAHRSHLYQRLHQTGLSHAAVASLYGALAAINSVCAIGLAERSRGSGTIAAISVATTAAGLWIGTVIHEKRSGTRGRAGDQPSTEPAQKCDFT